VPAATPGREPLRIGPNIPYRFTAVRVRRPADYDWSAVKAVYLGPDDLRVVRLAYRVDDTLRQNRAPKPESAQIHPKPLDPFVGVWESDEMDEPPVTVDKCLQDATKKFYLQIYEATPGTYVARLRSETTGHTHPPNSSDMLPAPPCSSSVPAFHVSHDFPSSIAGVADYVLSLEIHAWQDQFIAKFKLNSNELLPLPGGFDTLLNNTNRATYANSSAHLGFYRR